MMPELKPVWGWPGYHVSADGQIWSSRQSKDGSLKKLKIRADGTILLSGPSGRRQVRVAGIIEKAYGTRTE